MDGLATRVEAETDDRELLARFVEGRDDRAFAALVDRHGRMALGVCRRILGDSAEADDAFQATFLVLMDRAESLHRSPAGNRALGGWLYRVAANAALQVRRRAAARRRLEEAFARGLEGSAGDDSPSRDVLPVLVEELGRLPDRYRAPLVLCYYQGRSQHDAAEELGVSYSTLRRRLDQARETLRSRLTSRGCAIAPAALVGLLTAASAQAARIDPDEVEALAGPLEVDARGASPRALGVSRAILRAIRNQMICRGAGVLVLLLLLGSTGLIARGPDAPGPAPMVEAKAPIEVASEVDPEPPGDEGVGILDSPRKPTDPDPVAAQEAARQAEKGEAPGTPEMDREILDALKAARNQAVFQGSISINGQSREFRNANEFGRALQGMAGPGNVPEAPQPPPAAQREGRADPAPPLGARARPPENAAIDREIRNAVRKGQLQRRRRVPPMIAPGFNGMWGVWGMPGFGGAGRGWMPGFGGAGGAGGLPGMPGFGGAGGAGGLPGFGGAGGMPGMPGIGGAGGMGGGRGGDRAW